MLDADDMYSTPTAYNISASSDDDGWRTPPVMAGQALHDGQEKKHPKTPKKLSNRAAKLLGKNVSIDTSSKKRDQKAIFKETALMGKLEKVAQKKKKSDDDDLLCRLGRF
jgi:hypothetical protein